MILTEEDILISVKVEGEEKYKELREEQKRTTKSTEEFDDALETTTDSMGRLRDAQGRFIQEAGKANKAVGGLKGSFTELNSVVQLTQAVFLAARASAEKLAQPIGLATSFEKEFAQIKTLSSRVGDELEQGLLNLAATLPQTAGDITKAAYQAISAGIDPDEAVGFLDAASKAAVAGNTSLTESVDLLTTATNAYKATGLSAKDASDQLFATIRAGKTTAEELSASLGQVAPVASQFGVSLAEIGAGVAVITKQGSSTSEAMTQLNALIKGFVNPSQKAAKTLKKLGVEYGATAIKTKGLTGVVEDLLEKSEGNVEVLGKLFDRFEATRALLTITSGGMQTYAKDLENISSAAGLTEEAFQTMQATTQGQIDLFQAQLEGVLSEVGKVALPAVNEALRSVGSYLSQHGPVIVETMMSFAGALLDAGRWVSEHGDEIIALLESIAIYKAIGLTTIAIQGLGTALTGLAASAAAAGGGIAALGAALSAGLASPVFIAAATAAAYFAGDAIGTALGESMTESYRREADVLELEVKQRSAALAKALKDAGVKSTGELRQLREDVRAGALISTAGVQTPTADVVYTPKALIAEFGAFQAEEIAIAQAEDLRLRADAKRNELEAASSTLASMEAEFQIKIEELAQKGEEAAEATGAKGVAAVLRVRKMEEEVANFEILVGRYAQDVVTARKAAEQSERGAEETLRKVRAALQASVGAEKKPPKKRRDPSERKARRVDPRVVDARRAAQLIEDEEERRLRLLGLKQAQEQVKAKKNRENLITLEQLHFQQREKLLESFDDKRFGEWAELERRRAGLIEDRVDRELALLDVALAAEQRKYSDNQEALALIAQTDALQRQDIAEAQSQRAKEIAAQAAEEDLLIRERSAELIEDETAQKLEILAVAQERERLQYADNEQMLTLITQDYARQRQAIEEGAAEAKASAWKAAADQSILSLDSLSKSLKQLGMGSMVLEGTIMAARGLKAGVDAMDYYASAAGEYAGLRFPTAIAYTAAALAKTATSAAYFKGAAELGGRKKGGAGGVSKPSAPKGLSGSGSYERPGRRSYRGRGAGESTTVVLRLDAPSNENFFNEFMRYGNIHLERDDAIRPSARWRGESHA